MSPANRNQDGRDRPSAHGTPRPRSQAFVRELSISNRRAASRRAPRNKGPMARAIFCLCPGSSDAEAELEENLCVGDGVCCESLQNDMVVLQGGGVALLTCASTDP